jgi:hypothetical protein
MLKYLLDTNIVIYVIRRRPIEVMALALMETDPLPLIGNDPPSPWRRVGCSSAALGLLERWC